MNAKKCDRCGKYYDIYMYKIPQKDNDRHGNKVTIFNNTVFNDHQVESFDLCNPCMTKLEKFLGMNKETDKNDQKGNT